MAEISRHKTKYFKTLLPWVALMMLRVVFRCEVDGVAIRSKLRLLTSKYPRHEVDDLEFSSQIDRGSRLGPKWRAGCLTQISPVWYEPTSLLSVLLTVCKLLIRCKLLKRCSDYIQVLAISMFVHKCFDY